RRRATRAAANRHPSGAAPARAAAAARVGRNARHADPSAEAGARARAAALPVGNIVRSLVSRFRSSQGLAAHSHANFGIKGDSSRTLQPIRKDLVIRFRRQRLAREAIMAAKEISVKKYVVRLSVEERERLETLIRKGKSPARRVLKARILLKADVSEAGKGWSDNRIIEALETSPSMVY